MIGFLEGKIVVRDAPQIVIDVSGVGYQVIVPKSVFAKSSTNGQKFKIFTYTHVRDDCLELFGFETPEDLKLFKVLIGVSGVCPRTAMNIFGVGNREAIVSAIVKGDVAFFTLVPRLGKKNAQKIIIELNNKFGSIEDLDLSEDLESDEALVGLKNFGFSQKEAMDALRGIRGEGKTAEEKIRLALRYLGKK